MAHFTAKQYPMHKDQNYYDLPAYSFCNEDDRFVSINMIKQPSRFAIPIHALHPQVNYQHIGQLNGIRTVPLGDDHGYKLMRVNILDLCAALQFFRLGHLRTSCRELKSCLMITRMSLS